MILCFWVRVRSSSESSWTLCGAVVWVVLLCGIPLLSHGFECENKCRLGRDTAYPHLVVGLVTGSAAEPDASKLFRTMRKDGRWQSLPPSEDAFLKRVQPVSIQLPSGRSYTVLISREEGEAAPLKAGDLVRYAPHRNINEKPPTEAIALAFWNITGCIAILCRAGDQECAHGFLPGVYGAMDGMPLGPDGKIVGAKARAIDPLSMRPR